MAQEIGFSDEALHQMMKELEELMKDKKQRGSRAYHRFLMTCVAHEVLERK